MTITELESISKNITNELATSASGGKSSFPFITHTLSQTPLVNEGEVFQVLVVGGSIFKKALAKRVKGEIILSAKQEKPQPQFLDSQALFTFLTPEIDTSVKTIAINFAYPLQPLFEHNRLDGTLLRGSKENTFTDLIGKRVGQEIENFIQKTFQKNIQVSLANDTICLLLSGLTKYQANEVACGIVGTGLNFALFLNETTAVNLEGSEFSSFQQSEAGLKIDKESKEPGVAVFEKEVSGAYLYKHYNYKVQKDDLPTPLITSTEELDIIAKGSSPFAKYAQDVLKSSAYLVAAQIAGITNFKQQDLTFIMEGSLFWKGYQYKEIVEQTVKTLCPLYKITCTSIGDSVYLGPAKLVA